MRRHPEYEDYLNRLDDFEQYAQFPKFFMRYNRLHYYEGFFSRNSDDGHTIKEVLTIQSKVRKELEKDIEIYVQRLGFVSKEITPKAKQNIFETIDRIDTGVAPIDICWDELLKSLVNLFNIEWMSVSSGGEIASYEVQKQLERKLYETPVFARD